MNRVPVGHLLEMRLIEDIHGRLLQERPGRQGRDTRFALAFGFDDAAIGRAKQGEHQCEIELARVLEDPPEDRRERLIEIDASLTDVQIDPVIGKLVEGLGLDPFELSALSCWTQETILIDLDGGDSVSLYHRQSPSRASATVYLGNMLAWEHDWDRPGMGLVSIEAELPHTVRAAIKGRPLRDIVSHRVLDGLPLVVESAKDASQGIEAVVRLAGPA